MNERILVIEDDQAILKLLQRGLVYEATRSTRPWRGALA
jgi:DNA-binding response OmpR family regulator